MVGRGSLRWVVVILFHAVTILALLVTTYAYYYYLQQTYAGVCPHHGIDQRVR